MPRARRTEPAPPNGKRHATPQSVNAAVWSICDIMRRGGATSALQYVPELTWILFLRILDETEDREAEEADRDRRTPAELLDLIEAKGREVQEAVHRLRTLASGP